MAELKLENFEQDIRDLLAEGMTQVQIRAELERRYGEPVARSTMSDFLKLKGLTPARPGRQAGPYAPPFAEDGQPLPTVQIIEALGERFYEAVGQELTERMGDMLNAQEEAGSKDEERYQAILKAIQEQRPSRLEQALDHQAKEFERLYAALRGMALLKVWVSACFLTSLVWAIAGFVAYRWFLT